MIYLWIYLVAYRPIYWLTVGLAYTDTSRDVEAIYHELCKLGAGTTTAEFTLHATGTASRQASVTEFDNQPRTNANDKGLLLGLLH